MPKNHARSDENRYALLDNCIVQQLDGRKLEYHSETLTAGVVHTQSGHIPLTATLIFTDEDGGQHKVAVKDVLYAIRHADLLKRLGKRY